MTFRETLVRTLMFILLVGLISLTVVEGTSEAYYSTDERVDCYDSRGHLMEDISCRETVSCSSLGILYENKCSDLEVGEEWIKHE